MELNRLGLWTFQFDQQPVRACLAAAQEIEALGYPALWIPEVRGREAISLAALLLAATEHLVIATGIARASERQPRAMWAAQQTLAEAYPDRFLLGIGGQTNLPGADPVDALAAYVRAMEEATYSPPRPAVAPPRVLAAINGRMLDLAAEISWGAHTYLSPPEHIAWARERVGGDVLLACEQPVVLETEPATAREIARRHLRYYLRMGPYRKLLARMGTSEQEMEDGGSDRVVDTLVAWGDESSIGERARACIDAGADHVCLQVLPSQPDGMPMDQWRTLASVSDDLNRSPQSV